MTQYYTHQGALEVTTSFLVAVGTTNVYTVNNVVQSDFSGSAVVFSDQLLSAEMTLDTGNRAVTVPGQTQGESMLNLLGLRRTSTEASVFAVTNVSSTPATVVINYSGADCDETVQLNAFTMYVRSLLTNFCLGNNYQGAASISASSPARANELIATAVRYSLDTLDVVDASNGVTTPLAITLSQYGIINQAVPLLALTLLFVPTIGLLFRRRLQKGT